MTSWPGRQKAESRPPTSSGEAVKDVGGRDERGHDDLGA
jgi:hypothetical protein